MRRLLLLIAVFTFALAGCSQESGQNSGNSNGSGGSQYAPQPMEYGDNQRLDSLYDRCKSGEAVACESLYLDSPVGSEYETFAIEQGGAEEYGEPAPAPDPKTAGLGEEVSFSLEDGYAIDQPFSMRIDSVEKYESLERNPEYDSEGSTKGPFVVAQMTFTNNSEEYISPGEVVQPELLTSKTTQGSTGDLSFFKVQPEETEILQDAAPNTSKKVVVIHDIAQDAEVVGYELLSENTYEEGLLEVPLN